MGEAPETLEVAGVTLYRDFRAEHLGQKSGNPWTNHWSLSMGARTREHAAEIGEKCVAAGVSCQFDELLRIKVDGKKHQQRLADAIFGKGKVSNHDRYY